MIHGEKILVVSRLARGGGHQLARVGMNVICVEILGRQQVDHFTAAHHGDAVGDLTDEVEIVGDEEKGGSSRGAQRQQQFDDLCLHRDVQRRGDLVADHELRSRGECPRDGDALLLAA